MSGQEDGKPQADYCVGKTGARGIKRRRTVQSSATCAGKRRWCLGSEEPHCSIMRLAKRREGPGGQRLADFAILPHAVSRSFRAWRNRGLSRGVFLRKVKQPKCRILENKPQTQKERMDAKIQHWPFSHNDEPQAKQMNFTLDSIEALHRCVLSGHMVTPFTLLMDSGSAKRRRSRSQRTFWRHEHLSMMMAVATTTHLSSQPRRWLSQGKRREP